MGDRRRHPIVPGLGFGPGDAATLPSSANGGGPGDVRPSRTPSSTDMGADDPDASVMPGAPSLGGRSASPCWTVVASLTLFVLGAFGPASAADPIKVGPEITVSTEYVDYGPRVASDPAGNFMIVWEHWDYGDDEGVSTIEARRWFATGNEFLSQFTMSQPSHFVGTSESISKGNVGIASDAAGNFVVTYTALDYGDGEPECYHDACLFVRRHDANGISGPILLLRDPTDDPDHTDQVSNPEVAALGNGEFVIAWEGYDASGEGTFARRTVASGQPKGSFFRVNTFDEDYQGQYGQLAIAGDDDDRFVVVFKSDHPVPFPGGRIRGQLYDGKGKSVGTEFGLSSDDDRGFFPAVAKAPDGTFMALWNGDGVLSGRTFDDAGVPVVDDFTVYGGTAYQPAVAAADDSFVVVWVDERNGADEVWGQRFDLAGNELSSEFLVGDSANGYRYMPDVAAASNGDFVVSWVDSAYDTVAQRFQVEAPVEREIGVLGKVLVLSNKVPDDPEKNLVKWKATGPEVLAPPRGTSSDPRCNGDPPGTVKATVQFFSPTSGHDSGVIGLPCENWFALGGLKPGQVSKRSYRYRDSQLDQGPCKSVLVKGEKSITVKCQGKGEATDFPYDLEVGLSEGTVHAVLDMGLYEFCSSFPPDGSADGSDGKKFKGKNAPIVGCPP